MRRHTFLAFPWLLIALLLAACTPPIDEVAEAAEREVADVEPAGTEPQPAATSRKLPRPRPPQPNRPPTTCYRIGWLVTLPAGKRTGRTAPLTWMSCSPAARPATASRPWMRPNLSHSVQLMNGWPTMSRSSP